MKKSKPIVAKDATELASVLGLSPAIGVETQLRSDLNDKIIDAIRKAGLTHVQVAKLARTLVRGLLLFLIVIPKTLLRI